MGVPEWESQTGGGRVFQGVPSYPRLRETRTSHPGRVSARVTYRRFTPLLTYLLALVVPPSPFTTPSPYSCSSTSSGLLVPSMSRPDNPTSFLPHRPLCSVSESDYAPPPLTLLDPIPLLLPLPLLFPVRPLPRPPPTPSPYSFPDTPPPPPRRPLPTPDRLPTAPSTTLPSTPSWVLGVLRGRPR